MATLYVTEPGARLEKEYHRLRVSKDRETLLVAPLVHVSEVVLVGRVGVTTATLLALLDAGIGLTLVNRQGGLRGRLAPATAKNIPLRRQQYQRSDDAGFCLRLGQAVVAGKLRNSRTMARRMVRGRGQAPIAADPFDRLNACLKEAEASQDLPALLGAEGRGAKAYFAVFRGALRGGLTFPGRQRRPPPDPVNALLSLGYTLLAANLMTALEVVGLDPYCGFFHSNAYGRPALALDLMEEFRPLIVDSLALTLINKRMLDAADFRPGPEGGVYLRRRALKVFFEQYTRRLQTRVHHPLAGRALTYQKVFEVQARQIARLVKGEIGRYEPFLVK